MELDVKLIERAGAACELCASPESLQVVEVEGIPYQGLDASVALCATCTNQYNGQTDVNPDHWRCLNDSMWNVHPPVQVLAWRMLHRLRGEGWPVDLLEMMYLDDETRKWAQSTESLDGESVAIHKDVNGVPLRAGDTVILIKDLNVKGAGFKAKMGTAVRNISLPHDDPDHIEGRVEGQQIYIVTKYVKKQK